MITTNLPISVKMYITDTENKLENDKTTKVSFRIVTDKRTAYIEVPVTKTVDRSENPTIFFGKQTGLTFKLAKDGRVNASGRMPRKKIIDAGYDALRLEFLEAADAIWNHANA